MMVNVRNVVLLSLIVGLVLRLMLRRRLASGRSWWVPLAGRIALYVGVVGYVARQYAGAAS
jgi:hypothetical protein